MISRTNLDRLAGALMLNKSFREAFANDKLKAIQVYNQQQIQQRRRPLQLDQEELDLILSLPSTSPFSFITVLEDFVSKRGLALLESRHSY